MQGIEDQHTNPWILFWEFTSRICQRLPDTNTYQTPWHKALKARAKVAKAELALRGYQRIQRQKLKQALQKYLVALIEQAATVSVDWWEKLTLLRIGTKGKKVPQYLQPIPEIVGDDGMPFATATKAADGWVKAFAAIEGAHQQRSTQAAESGRSVGRKQFMRRGQHWTVLHTVPQCLALNRPSRCLNAPSPPYPARRFFIAICRTPP